MTKTITLAATFALLVSSAALAQTSSDSGKGSAPQAGVGGPADGTNGGRNGNAASSPPTSSGSAGTSKGTATGGNPGGASDRQ